MTPNQISLVKSTWAQLAPTRYEVGDRFYLRLFKIEPALRPLFRGDMAEQSRRLVVMLDIGVCGLDNLFVLLPILKALGSRHARYGVDVEHYGTVGAALLWALREGLKGDFTPEAEAAWTAFYGLIADTMQSGDSGGAPVAAVPEAA
jgi:hemoglobin-like flavoprotein